MKRIIVMLAFAIAAGYSCSKENTEAATGTVQDLTGLDGCGMVIVLDNGTKLEPTQVPEGVTLQPNKRVRVEYKEVQGASICMVGLMVKILELQYL